MRDFCNLSAPTNVAFIWRPEHHMELQVPLKITYMRGFCNLSAPMDIAFILHVEHHMKLQAPLKITYAFEQIC